MLFRSIFHKVPKLKIDYYGLKLKKNVDLKEKQSFHWLISNSFWKKVKQISTSKILQIFQYGRPRSSFLPDKIGIFCKNTLVTLFRTMSVPLSGLLKHKTSDFTYIFRKNSEIIQEHTLLIFHLLKPSWRNSSLADGEIWSQITCAEIQNA